MVPSYRKALKKAAIIYSSNDETSALEYLIDNYAIRIKYGECGFNKLQKYYTWDKRVEQMNQVYIKLKKENE